MLGSHQFPLARASSSLLPIHTLPDDLLSEVLDLAVIHARSIDVSRPRGYTGAMALARALNSITAVCKHWRAVALASPTLWRTILYGERADVSPLSTSLAVSRLSAYLERSAQTLIDVSLNFKSGSTAIRLLESLVTQHASRLRELSLVFGSQEDEPRFLPIRGPLPKLERFACVAMVDRSQNDDVLRIFERPETIRKIANLHIGDKFPLLTNVDVTSLRYLDLSVGGSFLPNIISLIRQAWSLELLSLLVKDLTSSELFKQELVLLDNLHSLKVSSPLLLSKLHAPNLKALGLCSITHTAEWPTPMPTWAYLKRVTFMMINTADGHVKALLHANQNVKIISTVLCHDNAVVPEILLGQTDVPLAIEGSTSTPMLSPSLELLNISGGKKLNKQTLTTLGSLLQRRPNLKIRCDSIVVHPLDVETLLQTYRSRFTVMNGRASYLK